MSVKFFLVLLWNLPRKKNERLFFLRQRIMPTLFQGCILFLCPIALKELGHHRDSAAHHYSGKLQCQTHWCEHPQPSQTYCTLYVLCQHETFEYRVYKHRDLICGKSRGGGVVFQWYLWCFLGRFWVFREGRPKVDFLGAFCYLFASFWRNWAHKRFQISRILILFLKPCINLQEAIDPNAIFSKSQQTIMWHRRTQETTKNYLNMVSRLWEIPSNGHGSASAHWKKNILTKRFLKVKIF